MLSAGQGRIESPQPWLIPMDGYEAARPPAHRAWPSPRPSTPAVPARILVVEDERAVRAVVANFLKQFGYDIIEADNPGQALAVVSDSTERFDVLLSDVVMPGMSGPALMDAVLAVRPNVRVILMSGYTDQSTLKARGLDPHTPFLQKPFSPDALAKKVREVLEQ
ncbi:MAG: response regulator [Acidobacteria bacterium]|nr:response regulator [Acidobacteriota bacterium]